MSVSASQMLKLILACPGLDKLSQPVTRAFLQPSEASGNFTHLNLVEWPCAQPSEHANRAGQVCSPRSFGRLNTFL